MNGQGEKIVILGGRGMLGTDLADECTARGIDYEVFDLPDFDITSDRHLNRALEHAGAVVNCVGYTNVEKAETETELAYRVNAEAVGRLGVIAAKKGLWVLHFSSDFVFDGTSDKPYTETDTPNPINAYGKTKLAGEKLLIESCCRYCIIRLEWTYGVGGNNFVRKILDRGINQGQLKVVDDQIGSPTATSEVAGVICDILPKKPQGIFHFASDEYASRFDMAKFVFDKLGIAVRLERCKTSDFPAAAVRPLNSRFDCSRIKALLGRPIMPWQGPLENFLRRL